MPSLLTSARADGARSGLSRVNSFKREWGDEDKQPQTSQTDWSPSPEVVKRKNPVMPPPNDGLTPAERRRRAILESMSQNQAPKATRLVAHSPEPSVAAAKRMGATLAPPPAQPLPSLPSLPGSSASSLRAKRPLPWEEGFSSAKKVMDANGALSSKNTLRGRSSTPSMPTISIRQKIQLSVEQQKVLQLVVDEGKSIFFTGSAGAGKSVLLREIIASMRKKFAKTQDAVAVTASTGIAACNIGGVTLHSFGGAGLATASPQELVKKIRMNKKAAARWQRTRVLIIDEVSMVDAELFDKFNRIGQILRKKPNEPFGGIQLVVTGDFFQLPPVTKGNVQPKFCFEAETWEECIKMQVNLTQVFRQRDETFVRMLNEMRFGKLTPGTVEAFRGLSRPIVYDDGIEATELFPRRDEVDRSNNTRLGALNTEAWSYQAIDGGALKDPAQREKMLQNFMAPQTIWLKIGAQVMLVKNVDETLVNGSMGTVIGFAHKAEFEVDAIGRWREGGPEDIDDAEEAKRQKLKEMLKSKISPQAKPLPIVRFKVPGGGERDMLAEYDQWKTELPSGEVQVSRSQVPLILSWAMSIHKSQGQTLERVKVDLGKVFEKGQAYVALSRATSLEGLEVRGFSASKVMAHPKVVLWTEKLKNLTN